ncbi:ribonuclease E/G [Phyllobacterium phragmitis]|uniref:Ribonuclease E n=1 Tax=Phyllobacterium phragmitis TaxID=2670329 RepID=A0A2S9INE0_9HYPH|nr:Rne/Rng family ribonuclease [Phyllobacterium phragmitis]PRD42039.1 ribonuclease E/G [Phyllobacterium phragmitis]
MSNKMLIDASHQEETRVVVVRGNRIEEFDFESEHKKQLKGNIYLARVTRVEPSLQAAFVEYGGNRHGFLAFSEIHPDYYQIPVADRIALLEAEAQAASEEDEDDEGNGGRSERGGDKSRRGKRRGKRSRSEDEGLKAEDGEDGAPYQASSDEEDDDGPEGTTIAAAVEGDVISEDIPDSVDLAEDEADTSDEAPSSRERAKRPSSRRRRKDADDDNDGSHDESDIVESVGAEDALEEVPTHQRTQRRQYKIQEVVKRRQILLVQVVKEERGNKGAALTTYLSLAGRYSVLMPNTARGGGISRKITSPVDRKRLKEIVKELEVPKGMGVILRTAGANRTKAEVKRDYEYLMRLWENVRALTLQSTAPALVYEEGSLIKRSIRDLYNKDIGEILVAGEDGYREAKDFMRMLMPSHAKVVQPYRDQVPIFARNGIEAQLDRMLQPQVTLKSGGYIIINQTEALVAIDVNSGRSTREHSIEDTALQTNLEAAEEVARQLRLRDLAGLVVIDFIDMEEKRNNRAVEKRMKDCLKDDRARIQVGRISHFGLLEMSRQRIRASVLESTMQVCAHCGGTGYIRSASSVALHVIRSIEEYLLRHSQNNIIVRTPVSTALYVLNHKRKNLADLELRFGLTIDIEADDSVGSQHLAIDKGTPALGPVSPAPVTLPYPDLTIDEEPLDEPDIPAEDEEFEADDTSAAKDEHSDESGRKRRRRRRRRGGRDRDSQENAVAADAASGDERVVGEAGDISQEDGEQADLSAEAAEEERRKKRRRGRRGGRKNRRNDDETNDNIEASSDGEARSKTDEGATAPVADLTPVPDEVPAAALPAAEEDAEAAATVEGKPVKKPVRRRTPKAKPVEEVVVAEAVEDLDAPLAEEPAPQEKPAKPARKSRKKVVPVAEVPEAVKSDVTAEAPRSEEKPEEKAEETPVPTEPAITPPEPSKPVVTSNSAEEKDKPKPKRAGWWQKKGFF